MLYPVSRLTVASDRRLQSAPLVSSFLYNDCTVRCCAAQLHLFLHRGPMAGDDASENRFSTSTNHFSHVYSTKPSSPHVFFSCHTPPPPPPLCFSAGVPILKEPTHISLPPWLPCTFLRSTRSARRISSKIFHRPSVAISQMAMMTTVTPSLFFLLRLLCRV